MNKAKFLIIITLMFMMIGFATISVTLGIDSSAYVNLSFIPPIKLYQKKRLISKSLEQLLTSHSTITHFNIVSNNSFNNIIVISFYT